MKWNVFTKLFKKVIKKKALQYLRNMKKYENRENKRKYLGDPTCDPLGFVN